MSVPSNLSTDQNYNNEIYDYDDEEDLVLSDKYIRKDSKTSTCSQISRKSTFYSSGHRSSIGESLQNDTTQSPLILSITKDPSWSTLSKTLLTNMTLSESTIQKFYSNYPFYKPTDVFMYLPEIDNESKILNSTKLKQLHGVLPCYLQYTPLKLLYRLTVDGSNVKTFLYKSYRYKYSLIVVKDDDGNIFGAFNSDFYEIRNNFYGNGECFLFTFFKGDYLYFFPATGCNENYVYSNEDQVCFGCSNEAFGLSLYDDFSEGYSEECTTYKNCVLCGGRKRFKIFDVELWGISY